MHVSIPTVRTIMNTMKLFFLALMLTCMAGCSYDMSDVIGEHESNVLDPSKGFDSQGKDALVYGKITNSVSGDAIAGVDIEVNNGTAFVIYGNATSDENGMYGVRIETDGFTSSVYIDATNVNYNPLNNIDVTGGDYLGEGEVIRLDLPMVHI
jgi:hypothetical protein